MALCSGLPQPPALLPVLVPRARRRSGDIERALVGALRGLWRTLLSGTPSAPMV
jgi:hypothetical protein